MTTQTWLCRRITHDNTNLIMLAYNTWQRKPDYVGVYHLTTQTWFCGINHLITKTWLYWRITPDKATFCMSWSRTIWSSWHTLAEYVVSQYIYFMTRTNRFESFALNVYSIPTIFYNIIFKTYVTLLCVYTNCKRPYFRIVSEMTA